MPVYLIKTDHQKKKTFVKRWRHQVVPEGALKIEARTKKEAGLIWNEALRKIEEEERNKKGSTVSQTSQVKTQDVDLDKSIQSIK